MPVVRIGILAALVVATSVLAQSEVPKLPVKRAIVPAGVTHVVVGPNITSAVANSSGSPNGELTAVEVASGYEIARIPYWGGRFAWVDNDLLLFTGAPHPRNELDFKRPPALFEWRVSSGIVTKLSDLGEAPDVCYDRGHLYVSFNRGDERVIRQGPINQQKETVLIRRKPLPIGVPFNRYDCRFRETPQATRPQRYVGTVLREDHGFIEMEYGASPDPERRYFLASPKGQPIPIDLRCGAGGPRYVDFVPAYVFQDGRSFSDHKVGPLVCVVGVNGTVSTYQLPAGDWLRATVYGVPVQSGILMVSLATAAKADGAYLVISGSVEKIISGYINYFAVSPDGCKVALSISPRHGVRAQHAVLNVCKRGG